MPVVSAFLVPDSPLPLLSSRQPAWTRIAEAYRRIGAAVAASHPDILLVYAGGWTTQTDQLWLTAPVVSGIRQDQIAADSLELRFDLEIDSELAEASVISSKAIGIDSVGVADPSFAVDPGTITAQRFLDPDGRFKQVVMSNTAALDFGRTERLGGFAAAVAGDRFKRRVALIGIGDLAAGSKDDDWRRTMLDQAVRGEVYELRQFVNPYSKEQVPNNDVKQLGFLLGGMGGVFSGAILHAIGPDDRTDSAVIEFKL